MPALGGPSSSDELWSRIHSNTFVYEDRCWETCSGFCCANSHPDFTFRLILAHQGQTILYIGDEYDWFESRGQIPSSDPTDFRPTPITFDFGGPHPLELVPLPCKHLGLCDGQFEKPFLCKIYPFLPILGLDGTLEDVLPGTIFDLTFPVVETKSPCSLLAKKDQYLNRWRTDPQLLDSLRHPFIILYSQAAGAFADIYTRKLTEDAKLKGLRGPDFWRVWELRYLGGYLFDKEEFRQRVYGIYAALAKTFGPFLQKGERGA